MAFRDILFSDLEDMLSLKEALGYSRQTYTPYTTEFINFCGSRYPEAQTIKKQMVEEWLGEFQYVSPNTRTRALINLRTFTRYLASIGKETYVVDDEFSISTIPYVPVIMKDVELAQFFRGVEATTNSSSLPNKGYILPVLFRMIFCCGLRPAEPLNLKAEDVSLETGDIYIRQSKRRTDRHIIMSDDMLALCRRFDYIAGSREWFFQRPDGRSFNTKWLGHQFEQCYRNSGLCLPKAPNTYSLRHCFATYTMMRWCDEGKDIMVLLPYLSAYMGHTDIKHTLYYVHLLPERLRESAGIDWDSLDSVYPEVAHDE